MPRDLRSGHSRGQGHLPPLFVRGSLRRLVSEVDDDLFAGGRRAPDRDGLVPLERHVIPEDFCQLDRVRCGEGSAGQDHGSDQR